MKIWATLWVWQESHLPQRLTLKNEAGFQSFTFLAPVDTISKAQFLVLWKNPIWCKDRKNLWKSWVLRKLSPQSTLESTTFASNFCFWSNDTLFEVSFGFFSKTYKIRTKSSKFLWQIFAVISIFLEETFSHLETDLFSFQLPSCS